MGNNLKTKLNKNITVNKLSVRNFGQITLYCLLVSLENFLVQQINSIILDAKVIAKFKLAHFFDFEMPQNAYYLKQSLFLSDYWFLYAHSFVDDPVL